MIVDEAHSSQTGEAVKDLKTVLAGASGDQALELAEDADAQAEQAATDTEDLLLASAQARGTQANLSFFAFTATPKAKTLERFGEKTVDANGRTATSRSTCTRCAKRSTKASSSTSSPTTPPTPPTTDSPTPTPPTTPKCPKSKADGVGPLRVPAPNQPGAKGRDHR